MTITTDLSITAMIGGKQYNLDVEEIEIPVNVDDIAAAISTPDGMLPQFALFHLLNHTAEVLRAAKAETIAELTPEARATIRTFLLTQAERFA